MNIIKLLVEFYIITLLCQPESWLSLDSLSHCQLWELSRGVGFQLSEWLSLLVHLRQVSDFGIIVYWWLVYYLFYPFFLCYHARLHSSKRWIWSRLSFTRLEDLSDSSRDFVYFITKKSRKNFASVVREWYFYLKVIFCLYPFFIEQLF